ncbi:hypothetical protein C4572_01830 [Candidatus Parcubacteria bacterium]|nr:MAG: hypothetical protein C4572_01830 [Candidatus Parcubacteria bacterium]
MYSFAGFSTQADAAFFLSILLILWVLPWKGVALWKAARAGSKIWFIVLLVVNTLAILEILYIFVFSKRKKVEIEKNEAAQA